MKANPGIQRVAGGNAATAISAPILPRTSVNSRATTSVRIPVTEQNRARLRALRATELATWEPKPKTDLDASARAARATLRTQVAQLANQKRQEALLYGALACFSAAGVGYALWDSLRLFESWPAFVQFVQRLVA